MQLELPFDTIGAATPSERLRGRVVEYTRELVGAARARWPRARIPDVRVEFHLEGHSAGEACARTGTTNYNLYLLEKYGERFIERMVPHEVAHVVAERLHGKRVRPHGKEWKAVMAFFGAEPRVHHDFESRYARTVVRYPYRCDCEELHFLGARSHRRFRRGRTEYTCRRCGRVLEYTGTPHVERPSKEPGPEEAVS
jgi:SprT protein